MDLCIKSACPPDCRRRSVGASSRHAAQGNHGMSEQMNSLGQPIGFPVPGWSARPRPPLTPMVGRYCRVEPLDADRHAADLHTANMADKEGRIWTYLGYGPFASLADY